MTNALCLILLFVAVIVGGTYIGDSWGIYADMAFSFAGGCAVGHLGYEVFG